MARVVCVGVGGGECELAQVVALNSTSLAWKSGLIVYHRCGIYMLEVLQKN